MKHSNMQIMCINFLMMVKKASQIQQEWLYSHNKTKYKETRCILYGMYCVHHFAKNR